MRAPFKLITTDFDIAVLDIEKKIKIHTKIHTIMAHQTNACTAEHIFKMKVKMESHKYSPRF